MGRWRHFLWRHPEVWPWLGAAGAWSVLLAADLGARLGASESHAHHSDGGWLSAVAGGWLHWQLMVVAMMVPLLAPALRQVAFRSLWRRRHRAVLGFLVGYLAVWGMLGLVVCALLEVGSRAWPGAPDGARWAASAAFLAAAAWQWSAAKRRALVACHRTAPLSPRGFGADRDCVAFGGRFAVPCCVNCGVLMVACTLAGHALPILAACAAVGALERNSWRPRTAALSAFLVVLALLVAPWGPG